MEQKPECVTSSVKITEPNTSNDTNFVKEHTTLTPPVPNVIMLGLLFLLTLATIYAGYIHGNMHLLTTLKNASS